MREDEMGGWHHGPNGHESEQILGDTGGQRSLARCSPWGHSGNCQTLYFWAPKSLQMVIAAMKLKDAYPLEGKL